MVWGGLGHAHCELWRVYLCGIKTVVKCLVIKDRSAVVGNGEQTGSSSSRFSGTLTISEGATFTEELRNRSNVHFKALAFDTELLVIHFITNVIMNYDITKSCRR